MPTAQATRFAKFKSPLAFIPASRQMDSTNWEMEDVRVLFEYGGSRKPLCVCSILGRELEKHGLATPTIHLSSAGSIAPSSFLLQRWSSTWNAFVDVQDIEDQDKITVVPVSAACISRVYHRKVRYISD